MISIKHLSQIDPAWKNKQLGNGSSSTIGQYGCLLTDITMVCNYYGFDETPASLNDKMRGVGGFQGIYIIPAFLPVALPGMIFRDFLQCRDQPAPLAQIDACLAADKPVIVEVDYSPSAGMQNHWIILTAKKGDDYVMIDPYPYPVETKEVTLKGRYGFAGGPSEIIQSVVWLDSSRAPVVKPGPVTPGTGVEASFVVYATADALAIRSQPLVAETTLLKRVAIHTRLAVLESDLDARAKIGVMNQWLAVRDPSDGTEGYTAAWYVAAEELAPSPAQPVNPNTGTRTPQYILKTIVDGLAVRRVPVINDTNLIKRVPLNSDLIALDPLADVQSKLGVLNQWLQVKDLAGDKGYVAAWYVTPAPGQAALGTDAQQPAGVSFDVGGSAKPEPLMVRAAEEGLALRKLPVVTRKTLIKRVHLNAELLVLEPRETALSKIGVPGQWLLVKDINGKKGYVAAWHVLRRPNLPAVTLDSPIVG
jgi:hypothetical protein